MKTGLDTMNLWVRQIFRSRFLFYPLFVFIYTMNWMLDLPCIALLRLWMWNYPIHDPENGIQGDFILSPFSIRQNIGLNRGELWQSDTTFCEADSYLESGYSRMTIPKMETHILRSV